jgi:hypothetical protein
MPSTIKLKPWNAILLIAALLILSSVPARAGEPFLDVVINVPQMLLAAEKSMSNGEDGVLSALKQCGVSTAHIFLYPDEEFEIVPVVVLDGTTRAALTHLLDGAGLLAPYVEKISVGIYRLKEAPTEPESEDDIDGKSQLSAGRFRIWLLKEGAIIAPVSIVKSWKQGATRPMATSVAKLAAQMHVEKGLLAVAVTIPETFGEKVLEDIEENSTLQDNPIAGQIAEVGVSILGDMFGSLRKVKTIGFRLGLGAEDERSVAYVQQFRKQSDAAAAYRQLKGGEASADAEGMISTLLGIVEDGSTTSRFGLKNDRLIMSVRWQPENDEVVMSALMEPIMEMMMGEMIMSGAPSDGPIETKYITDQHFSSGNDIAAVKKALKAEIKKRTFVGSFWGQGAEPRTQIEIDPLEVANGSLMKITYDVKSIKTIAGVEVLRKPEDDKNRSPSSIDTTLDPKWRGANRLSLDMVEGTKGEELGVATIQFNCTLPSDLAVFEFSKDEIGKKKKQNGATVTLNAMERDMVSISYKGADSASLIAYDTTGGALSLSSGSSGGSSMSQNYHGEVEKVKVAIITETTDTSVDVTIDLLKGKNEELPDEPSENVRERYKTASLPAYAEYTDADFSDLTVKPVEAGERGWQDKLAIELPKGPFMGSAGWKASLFAGGKGVLLDASPGHTTTELSYDLKKGMLKKVDAAFGVVSIRAHCAIQRLVFEREKAVAASVTLPSGRKVAVTFDKNTVRLGVGDVTVLKTIAYAANGRALKGERMHGGTSAANEKSTAYWGQPSRVVVLVADGEIKQEVEFDLRLRTIDEPAYAKYKKTCEIVQGAVATMKLLDKVRRRSSYEYDDTVAGFYYLYDRMGNPRPEELITEALAHSDPNGQERYGYKAKPYNGYHYTWFKGVMRSGKKVDCTHSEKAQTYRWKNGEFELKPYSENHGFVAIPVDKSMPTILRHWSEFHIKHLDGAPCEYLPSSPREDGWTVYR